MRTPTPFDPICTFAGQPTCMLTRFCMVQLLSIQLTNRFIIFVQKLVSIYQYCYMLILYSNMEAQKMCVSVIGQLKFLILKGKFLSLYRYMDNFMLHF